MQQSAISACAAIKVLEQDFDGRAPAQGLARPVVELPGEVIELALGVPAQVGALGQVLSNQTVGVLADAPLPRAVWVSEVDLQPVLSASCLCNAISLPWS